MSVFSNDQVNMITKLEREVLNNNDYSLFLRRHLPPHLFFSMSFK